MMNQYNWGQDKDMREWLLNDRLDGFSRMVADVDKTDTAKMAVLSKVREYAMPAGMKLQQFLAELNARG